MFYISGGAGRFNNMNLLSMVLVMLVVARTGASNFVIIPPATSLTNLQTYVSYIPVLIGLFN